MKKPHLLIISIALGSLASCVPSVSNPVTSALNTATTKLDQGAAAVTETVAPAAAVTPVGLRPTTGEANLVISPYKPYNLIDVTGYKSGDKVGDPSTATTDPTTGKTLINTSKHFLIP